MNPTSGPANPPAASRQPAARDRVRALPHTHHCFVCGESNRHGLNLRFETDGQIVHCRFTPRPEHVGFKETVHGGLIATVLDEVMVWACAVRTKRFAYSAELTVRFSSPLQPGIETNVFGELVNDRRGKIFETRGEIRSAGGQLLASATGKYMPITESQTAVMATDFVGDASEWVGKKPAN